MIFNFILVFLLGMVFALILLCRSSVGLLKVCIPDDPDENPYLYAELDSSVNSICKKKYVLFRVKVYDIYSQK